MELDDFKNALNKEPAPSLDTQDISRIKDKVQTHEAVTRRSFFMESAVALFAFTMIIIMLVLGPAYYPKIIGELLPDLVKVRTPELNSLMYAGMILSALYCLYVPIKLFRAQQVDGSLGWTVSSRVEQEIARLEHQKVLWSKAHIWSLAPAALIGILFFWGLQLSLIQDWVPTPYLMGYLAFVALSFIGGLWSRNRTIERDIKPVLEDLYQLRNELQD